MINKSPTIAAMSLSLAPCILSGLPRDEIISNPEIMISKTAIPPESPRNTINKDLAIWVGPVEILPRPVLHRKFVPDCEQIGVVVGFFPPPLACCPPGTLKVA